MLRLCLFTNIVLAAAECAPGENCYASTTGTSLLQSKQTIDKLKLVEHVQAEVVANLTQTEDPCLSGGPYDKPTTYSCPCMCPEDFPWCEPGYIADWLPNFPMQLPGVMACYNGAGYAKSKDAAHRGWETLIPDVDYVRHCWMPAINSYFTFIWDSHYSERCQNYVATPNPTPYPTPYPTLNPTPTPTPNPTPNPTPMPTQHITIDFGNVKQNNLGGLGPDSGDAELRFGTVATLGDGSVVDLVVTTGSSYDPVQPKANGKKAEFAKINQASGGSYEYTFSFQEAATGESIKIDSFSMSFVDVDGDAQKEVKETVSVCGASSLRMANITHLQSSADGECYTIVPTSLNASENVQSLATMTGNQKAHAFTATFSQTATFTVKTIVSPSSQEHPQQRALLFAGVAIDF